MATGDILITTGIDSLIRLIHEKKKIEIEDAAALLGLPVDVVEDWSSILESQGIIKIKYQFTHAYLVWTAKSEKEILKRIGNVGEQIQLLSSQVARLISTVEMHAEDVSKSESEIKKFLKTFDKQYGDLYDRIDKLRKAKKKLSEYIEAPRMELTRIKISYDELEEKISKSVGELNRLQSKFDDFEKKHRQIRTINKIRDEFDEKISNMFNRYSELEMDIKEINKRVSEMNNLLPALYKSNEVVNELVIMKKGLEYKISRIVNKENEINNFVKQFKAKNVNSYIDKLKNRLDKLSGTIAQIRKQINDVEGRKKKLSYELKQLNDSYLKLRMSDIRKLTGQVEKDIEHIDKLLLDYKKAKESIKDVSRIEKKTNKIKNDLDVLLNHVYKMKSDLKISVDQIKQEMDKMIGEISPFIENYNSLKSQVIYYNNSLENLRKSVANDIINLNETIKKSDDLIKKNTAGFDKKIKELETLSREYNQLIAVKDNLKNMLLLMKEVDNEKNSILYQLKEIQKKINLLRSLKGDKQVKELINASSSLKQVKRDVNKMSKKKVEISKMIDNMIEKNE